MRIGLSNLRMLIREALEVSDEEIRAFLSDQAATYHQDHSLDIDGDEIPDASAIRELLQADFLNNFSHISISDYADLIDRLSVMPDVKWSRPVMMV
tara:strand:- start:4085 stop:4372 length:288 start_codon:yes stop_codon:yes gene_type:complete